MMIGKLFHVNNVCKISKNKHVQNELFGEKNKVARFLHFT